MKPPQHITGSEMIEEETSDRHERRGGSEQDSIYTWRLSRFTWIYYLRYSAL